MLRMENCRERQRQLLALLADEGVEIAVLSSPKSIYRYTGLLPEATQLHAFVINSSGANVLITTAGMSADSPPPKTAAEQVELYPWYQLDKEISRTAWMTELSLRVASAVGRLAPGGGAVGVEFDWMRVGVVAGLGTQLGGAPINLTPGLDQLRRQKDPDEIECIRETVKLVEAGLAAAKSALEPGLPEYRVYSLYHDAIVAKAETSVEIKGDFACGRRAIRGGGPPTGRKTQRGDLYIIDSFPSYEGYVCDFTRTFSVDGRPSQLQQDAWSHIMEAHEIARRMIHPGVPASEVYRAIKSHLDKFEPAAGSFWHHAGHGIGMFGWEFPWLTPGSEHVIQDREVIACEPALYSEALQGGIRLEHDYLVTPEGPVNLDHFPMDLT